MKQILYFLIGVLISFVFLMPFAYAKTNLGSYCSLSDAQQAAYDRYASDGKPYPDGYTAHQFPDMVDSSHRQIVIFYWSIDSDHSESYVRTNYRLYAYIPADKIGCEYIGCDGCDTWGDADGDGILDEYDLYPNDPNPYKFRVASYYINDLGKKIPLVLETDQQTQGNVGPNGNPVNDFFEVKECPDGYLTNIDIGGVWSDSSSLEDTLVQHYTDEDIQNFTYPPVSNAGGSSEIERSGYSTENPTGEPASDVPGTSVGVGSDSGDSTEVSSRKIVQNSDGIIKNQNLQSGYLKSINKELQEINRNFGLGNYKINTNGAASGSGGITKEEMEDVVNDPSVGPYSDDTTTNLGNNSVDRTQTYSDMQTRFGDRFDLFITDMQDTDLFSVPFGFFENLPSGGNSEFSYDLGYWGSSTVSTGVFDLRDYTTVWDILKTILIILAAHKWINIMVLKHA